MMGDLQNIRPTECPCLRIPYSASFSISPGKQEPMFLNCR